MKSEFLFLIMGKSGSGKTTVVYKLQELYGLKVLESYTTRAPRYDGEKGHIYLDPNSYNSFDDLKLAYPNRIAETVFNDHYYFATEEQANECDLYVIDPAGVDTFFELYKGPKRPFIIYIDVEEDVLAERMVERGDASEKIRERLSHDRKAFETAEEMAHCIIRSPFSDNVVSTIHHIMKERLRMDV